MKSNIPNKISLISCATILLTSLTASQPATASEPFIGTIKYFGFNFAPRGWATCDGQLLQVSQHDALFSLVGTIYGGDGRTTFGLPDMRGRMPVHMGQGLGLSNRTIGQKAGAETATITTAQLPAHSHKLMATDSAGNQVSPAEHTLAKDGNDATYRDEAPNVTMHASSITASTGSSQTHQNMSPYLVVNCNISLVGIYPSRN